MKRRILIWLVMLVLGAIESRVQAQTVDGAWRSRGYGAVIEINGNAATIYDETAVSFFPVAQASITGATARLNNDPNADPFFLNLEDGVLAVRNEATTIFFDRINAVPAIRGASPAPLSVFDVFWQTIDEHFASFELIDVDWDAARAEFRPRVSNGMSDTALFNLLAEMGALLGDRHTTLRDPSTGRFVNTGPRPSALGDHLGDDVLANVASNYAAGGQLTQTRNDTRLQYGTLNDGRLGYLAVLDFENRPMPFATSLNQVFTDLADVEALLIDLRHNGGGNNRHALELANRLVEREKVVYFQAPRFGEPEEFGEPQPNSVRPVGIGFRGRPVYLLTNDGTGSAGDVQALILSENPMVTQVGETTAGIFSSFTRGLPNGWIMTTTNERFWSVDGINYELRGIDPEIVARNTVAALNSGADLVVDAVLADHAKRTPVPEASTPVTAAMSGSWYAPDHDGEGFLLEILDPQTALVYWFTYAPDGSRQSWLVASGAIDGDTIEFDETLAPRGAKFGDDFLADDVDRQPWGRLTLRFAGCNRAVAKYEGPDAFGANFLSVEKLTGHVGVDCGAAPATASNALSGSWFDPERSGEGWIVNQYSAEQALLVWFTYEPDGDPLWLIGVGRVDGHAVRITELLRPVGAQFGPSFDPATVDRQLWGGLSLAVDSCSAAHVTWNPIEARYSMGSRSLVRLTQLAGVGCPD